MAEVQLAAGDEQRGAILGDLAEAHRHHRHRLVGGDGEAGDGVPEDRERGIDGVRGEAQAGCLLTALVEGEIVGLAVGAPRAAVEADGLDALDLEGLLVPRIAAERAVAEHEFARGDARRRPGLLGDPASRAVRDARCGCHGVLLVGDQHRVAVDPAVHALEPAVKPACLLREDADARRRRAMDRVVMAPRTNDRLARTLSAGEHAEGRVGVAVGPASHAENRCLDLVEVLAGRAMTPVVVAALVRHPMCDPRLEVHALEPRLAPALAVDRGHRRPRLPAVHADRPVQHVHRVDQATAVVDVVGVAIIRRVARHDGLQRRWAPRRDLQAVEAGPRVARHPDGARAPRLRGDPRDRVDTVKRLLLGVLVGAEA